jgi:ferritin-like protein
LTALEDSRADVTTEAGTAATAAGAPADQGAYDGERGALVELLVRAYYGELETLMNYLAGSRNITCDGHGDDDICESLVEDALESSSRAQLLALRIQAAGGMVPGSFAFVASQYDLQPEVTQSDTTLVLQAVTEIERDAVERYERIAEMATRVDPDTAELATAIVRERRQSHRFFDGLLHGR